MVNRLSAILIAFFTVSFFFLSPSYAEEGVTKSKILFGQTAAIKGPAAKLGKGMQDGILAAFKEANANGGTKGRFLELVTYDDGYEPNNAITNTNTLIQKDRVFALIGGVGTPTANAIEPITSRANVPFIAPFTGAEFLRNPYKRYVINIRGSYWQETEEWIERLTQDLKVKRIAILYQDDSYGRAGLSGVKRAMKKRGLELVAEGTYKRNTTAIKSALLSIRKSNPEAVVMVGAYKAIAEFIKLAKRIKMDAKFINISFVGSKALASELGVKGDGVIISQVVPFPFDKSNPIVASYHKALKNYDSKIQPGFVSLEGYISGRFVIEILNKINGKVTRESFIDTIYRTRHINLNGLKLTYLPENNQGMDKVFLTILQKDGTFKAVKKLKRGM